MKWWLAVSVVGVMACGDDGNNPVDAGSSDAPNMVDAAPVADEVELFTFQYGELTPARFVAVQDGDGPWQRLESGNGHYEFTPQSGRYGLVVVCEAGGYKQLSYVFATTAELPQTSHDCQSPIGSNRVELTVTGVGNGNNAWYFSKGIDSIGAMADGSRVFGQTRSGFHDGVLVETGDAFFPVRAGIKRDLDVPFIYELSWNASSETLPVTSSSVTANGALATGEQAGVKVYLQTRNGTRAWLGVSTATAYGSVPASLVVAPDVHVGVIGAGYPGEGAFRNVYEFFRAPKNLVATYPSAFGLTSASAVQTSPSVRVAFEFAAYPNAALYLMRAPTPTATLSVILTPEWLGSGTSHRWEQPDLSSVAGWSSGWALADNVEAEVESTAFTISAGGASAAYSAWREFNIRGLTLSADRDGLTMTEARSRFTFTP